MPFTGRIIICIKNVLTNRIAGVVRVLLTGVANMKKKNHTNYTSTHLHIKHLISYLDFSTGLNLGKGVGGGVGVDIGLLKEQ